MKKLKKMIVTMLAAMAFLMSFGGAEQVLNVPNQPVTAHASTTYVWVDRYGRGTKYHFTNPGRRYGRGEVNHHWSRVTIKWAQKHGYSQSLN